MATFKKRRPVKAYLIPMIAAFAGITAGWLLFPTQQDYRYGELRSMLEDMEEESFDVEASYVMEEETALQASGAYGPERSMYSISTPVSNDSTFEFTIHVEEEAFFVESGGDWSRGQRPNPIIQEMSPLDDPFTWMKTILPEADSLETGDNWTRLHYDVLDDVDFQGYSLQEQEETSLLVERSGEETTVTFTVHPVRPEDVPTLNRYPESMEYTIRFLPRERPVEPPPPEAEEGEPL
ncbi:hypothetical protein [Alkalicoccus urumqiensis]|uniref:Outer membrane lipoprotein carrier protein LolA n=1 Tax=Alkalicoccus urumqiensis TaxID=1548213 RepID=A0A2P6MJ24_ALKUR|nr:hypothetical protein [Alkalicoccus urumqiensis]PRO66298.1 hypothetical protein C6I21_05710 [Alkalicoccus urumqiensis]